MLKRYILFLLGSLVIPQLASCQMSRHAPPQAKIELPAGGVDLPMLEFKGLPVIEVKVDGKGPFQFIFDTGANISVIGEELQKEIALSPPPGVKADAVGDLRVLGIVSIPRLEIGAGSLTGPYAAVMPLSFLGTDPPRGVLSALMFPGYLVTFDYPSKRILIAKGELPAADSKTIFSYEDEENIPSVPIRIGGQTTRVHLDTGATMALMLPNKFLTQLPLDSEPKPTPGKKARLVGREFPLLTARVKGAVEVGDFNLDVGDVGFSDSRGGSGPPIGQLGSGVLKTLQVTLDAKNHRIRLNQAALPLGK